MVKIFTIVTGETWNSHKTFVEKLARKVQLTEVQGWSECDVILQFCPVASRPGHEIDKALLEIPANKPAVLVVMHHTHDPDRSVHDSSRYVTQSDVLTADCLFHEMDGLLRCPTNEEAVEKIFRYMRTYSKEEPPVQPVIKPESAFVPEWTEQEPIPDQQPTSQETATEEVSAQQASSKTLMKKISNISPKAAENLNAARMTDSQILSLTLSELSELLPGMENFQKRRDIMTLIREHFETSSLREKIGNISQTAVEKLHGISDAQILTLTLSELSELLPGMENFQKRRDIMTLIRGHFEGPIPGLLQEVLKVQERQLQAALDTNRLLTELRDKLVTQEELPRKKPWEGKKSRETETSNRPASRPSPDNQKPDGHPVVTRCQPDKKSLSSCSYNNPNSHGVPGATPPAQLDKKGVGSSSYNNPNPQGVPVITPPAQLDKKGMGSSSYNNPNSHGVPGATPPAQLDKKGVGSSSYNNPNSHGVPGATPPAQLDKKGVGSSSYNNPNSHGVPGATPPAQLDKKGVGSSSYNNPNPQGVPMITPPAQPEKKGVGSSSYNNPNSHGVPGATPPAQPDKKGVGSSSYNNPNSHGVPGATPPAQPDKKGMGSSSYNNPNSHGVPGATPPAQLDKKGVGSSSYNNPNSHGVPGATPPAQLDKKGVGSSSYNNPNSHGVPGATPPAQLDKKGVGSSSYNNPNPQGVPVITPPAQPDKKGVGSSSYHNPNLQGVPVAHNPQPGASNLSFFVDLP